MPVQPRLLNLSVFINEHLRDELTLDVLAARMNLSPFHFHRKFRAYFGESLHQHIKRLRLERSAHALLYRLVPVSAVARGSGYKTLSAFSHAFSAHFGVAPTRFREVMSTGRFHEQEMSLRERLGAAVVDEIAPERIENLSERNLVFLRANLAHAETLDPVCAALDQLTAAVGSGHELVIASSDLYGLTTGAPVRVDVARDATLLEPGARAALGQQVIAAGRYALFTFDGPATRVVDMVRAIYQFWVPRTSERARSATHYLTVRDLSPERSGHWTIYVPLEETVVVPAAAAPVAADVVGQS